MLHNLVIHEYNGRLSMIPWDYNAAFECFAPGEGEAIRKDPTDLINQGIDSPLRGASEENRPMWKWIPHNENYREEYHKVMDELLSGYFESGEFEKEEKGCDALKEFCRLRTESIRKQLNGELATVNEDQKNPEKVDASNLRMDDLGVGDPLANN